MTPFLSAGTSWAYAGAHAGIKSITLGEAADLFVAAKVSDTYVKGLRRYFARSSSSSDGAPSRM